MQDGTQRFRHRAKAIDIFAPPQKLRKEQVPCQRSLTESGGFHPQGAPEQTSRYEELRYLPYELVPECVNRKDALGMEPATR